MKQHIKFEDILNECMDRILQGETIDKCLKRYPEQAKELEPLLRTVMAARVVSTVQPRPEFKAKARAEFQAALRGMEAKKSRRWSLFDWRPQWQWQSGWAIAAMSVIVVLLAGGGTVAAATNSMPDNALYSVKLTTEKVQLAVTPSNVGKTELNVKFANRRVEELDYMASQGNSQEVQIIAQRLNTNLVNITNVTASEAVAPMHTNSTDSSSSNGLTFGAETATGALNDQQPMLGVAAAPAPASTPAPEVASAGDNPAPIVPAQVPGAPPSEGSGLAPTETAVAPQITVPPAQVTVNVPAPESMSGSTKSTAQDANKRSFANNNQVLSPEREELRKIIEDNYQILQSRLEATLEKSTPEVRPAIRQAIAQSQIEYEKAMSNLYRAGN